MVDLLTVKKFKAWSFLLNIVHFPRSERLQECMDGPLDSACRIRIVEEYFYRTLPEMINEKLNVCNVLAHYSEC